MEATDRLYTRVFVVRQQTSYKHCVSVERMFVCLFVIYVLLTGLSVSQLVS